jgi:hypothetical protein
MQGILRYANQDVYDGNWEENYVRFTTRFWPSRLVFVCTRTRTLTDSLTLLSMFTDHVSRRCAARSHV